MILSPMREIQLELSVELGRATRSLSVLATITEGTIISLNKLAGESLDIIVSGRTVAKGEVVIVDENFGVRVTEVLGDKK